MSVIVKTSYDNAKQYRGKSVFSKIDKKKHNVYFRVACDDFSIEEILANKDDNILVYVYEGMDTNPIYRGITSTDRYIVREYEFGNDITEDDIISVLEDTPSGVTPILKVPEDYMDFEFVCRMCDKYPRIRFCGGMLFCAKGCRLGCCGRDILDTAGIKYTDSNLIVKGCDCALKILNEEGLEFEVTDKKVKAKSTSSINKKSSSSKSTGGSKKKKLFGDLLGSLGTQL